MGKGCNRVAAAGDGGEKSLACALGGVFCDFDGGVVEGGNFERAERAVPDDRPRLVDRGLDLVDRLGAGVEHHAVLVDGIEAIDTRGRIGLEMPGDHAVDGQDDGAAGVLGLVHYAQGRFLEVALAQRFADIVSERIDEGVGHAAPDHQRLDLGDEVFEQVDLGGDLGAAHDCDDRLFGVAETGLERLQFGFHGAARARGQRAGEAFGRGMGAVGGREGVIDIDIAEGCHAGDQLGIVLFFARVKTGVFSKDHAAGLGTGYGCLDACDVRPVGFGEDDPLAHDFLQNGDDGPKAHVGHNFALGAVEMGEQDGQATLVGDFLDGVGDPLDPGGIGHHAVSDRHVEIDAQQHALAGQIEIIEGLEGGGHCHT